MYYLVIIVLICLLYIHIKYYIDYADSEQIYNLSNITQSMLDKITYLKLPVIFNYSINYEPRLDKINIIDISNNYNELCIKKNKGIKLIKASNYYTQYNTLINKINDTFFKPLTTLNAKYDILFGHKDTTTKLCSEYSYRTIMIVLDGSIDIMLIHPKYSDTLDEQLNCRHIVRESTCDVWEKDIFKDKIDHLEKGRAISVPMYWWWSIKFDKESKILQFKYYTYMNQIVILPILAQIWLNN